MNDERPGLLAPYRVLDLTCERGFLCGQVLGDLGADVIQVESPGGSPARRSGPFCGGGADPERSISWWSYNRNKRGITLNLDHPEGQRLCRELAARVDFLVESFDPGHLEERGLGYGELAARNQGLIYVSMTPFGPSGPKASWAESDLVLMAAGGPLWLYGNDDRPPIRVSVPQAWSHASTMATAGALVALHERRRSGRGQHVDVSAQQAVGVAAQCNTLAFALGAPDMRRLGGGFQMGGVRVPLVWQAKDGYVTLNFLFGPVLGVFTQRLMDYLFEIGWCDAATHAKNWIEYGAELNSGREPLEEYARVVGIVAGFVASRTKGELLELAKKRGLLIAPVATIEDVRRNEQLASRGYWREIPHPELGRAVRYPGPFARFGEGAIRYRRRAPLVGEHNREILGGELGLRDDCLERLRAEGVL